MRKLKGLLTFTIVIFISFIILGLGIIFFYINSTPNIALHTIETTLKHDVLSAKQIEHFLTPQIDTLGVFEEKGFSLGGIDMKMNAEHRGKIEVQYVENDSERPRVIWAYVDTEKGVLENIKDMGRDSKLYPGRIHLNDWNLDSQDAVRLAEDLFFAEAKNPAFRYDEIWLYSYNDSVVDRIGTEEAWCIYFTDNKNDIRYHARIDPYRGEIVSHTVERW